ncbi:MAG: P-II family nitrogen regulator [Planctomycetes bacterium]|nr:P-II family nitrogen regulator [Planctomycetota bacterium]
MKVVCIVKIPKLDAVLRALAPFPVTDLLTEEVRGYGRQKGHLELYQGTEYRVSFLPKVRVEFHAPPETAERAALAVAEAARTGRIGDGKILLLDEAPVSA